MRNTSTVLNKILAVFCVLSALFCGAMAAWLFLLPQEQYAQQLSDAQTQLSEAETALAQRVGAAQDALTLAQSEQENLSAQVAQAQSVKEEKEASYTALQTQIEDINQLPQTILDTRKEYGLLVRQLEEMVMAGETDIRICYLTFDDGPNNLTGRILDKLEELDVYVTFFTIGSNAATEQAENLRREMMGGHTVGNHTYSHDIFGDLYTSLDEFTYQVAQQDEKVYQATGFHTQLFRFPSGSVFCPFFEEAESWLQENGFYWVDWNASGWDSGFHSFDVGGDAISSNVIGTTRDLNIAVVLCHDFNYSTYQGLDIFIPEMQEAGFVFLPMFPESHMLDEPLPVV